MKKFMIVALVALLAACSGAASNNTNLANGNKNANASSNQSKTPVGMAPVPPGSSVSQGQIQTGGTKFPDWFPQYPGVDPKDVMSIAMHGDPEFTSGSFSTPDPPEQVIAFYQDAFKKAGLTVTVKKQKEVRNKVNVETTKLEAKDKTRKATVDADASDGKTMVGFTY